MGEVQFMWISVLAVRVATCIAVFTLSAVDPQASARQTSTRQDAGPAAALAPPSANSRTIVLGMSTALTGPAAALGLNMKAGVQSALDEANRSGGIAGSRLELIALDDGYEPTRAAPNMRRLIDTDHVVAVIGNVGTPTAVVAIPIATESRTPFVGAFTGAGVLRKTPPDRYVINFRASYAEETAAMVHALVTHAGLAPDQIAFFTQRDAYGDAGFAGGVDALQRHGLRNASAVTHARYDRNTTAVENAVADLLAAQPPARAVIMVGAYKPTAAFVKLFRSTGAAPIFLSVSFVGSEALAAELGDHGDGVIITQVVPPPDSEAPAAMAHRAALRSFSPEATPTFASLEGYVATTMFIAGLKQVKGPFEREPIITALEALGEFDVGLGETLNLTPAQHQACHAVWPTVIRSGRIVALDWAELASNRPGPDAHAGAK
jgi:branched-chain amino acid transport system substrate-binding protein